MAGDARVVVVGGCEEYTLVGLAFDLVHMLWWLVSSRDVVATRWVGLALMVAFVLLT